MQFPMRRVSETALSCSSLTEVSGTLSPAVRSSGMSLPRAESVDTSSVMPPGKVLPSGLPSSGETSPLRGHENGTNEREGGGSHAI